MIKSYFKVLICLLGLQMLFGFTAVLGQSMVNLTLINADTDQAIKTLVNGEVLNLATLPTKNLNIRANTNPAIVGSVVFSLNGIRNTESVAPYAYAGDNNGNFNAWTPATGSYTLTVTPYSASGGTGTAGTALTINFTVSNTTTTVAPSTCSGTGSITREYWSNVSGNVVSSIPVSSTPSSTTQLTSFEAPSNIADNYGQRIRGYICAPVSGNYTFYIAGDDNTELWLSTDGNTANRRRIAYVSEWTNIREWTKFASQKSESIYLQQGTKYYIEALHKEGAGGDNLAVAWTVPNNSSIAVITGANLAPFSATSGPVVTNQAPVANAGSDKSITLPTSSVVLNGSATDADGTIASYAWRQVSGPNQASFGGSTTACQTTYEEKNGLVVVEMENLPIPSGWRKNTAVSGYTGSSYIEWINAAQLSTPGTGLIETTVKISKTGKYYFQWRSKVGKGTSSTDHNDSWLKFPDASNFYAEGAQVVYPHGSGKTPNPNGAGANGWFKVFSSGSMDWTWSTNTSDHETLQIVAEFNTPGIYKIQISARSDYHLIDRFILRHATVSSTTAQALSNTETRCTSTTTSSGTNLASPTVSGLIQGSYVFRLTATDDKGATGSDDVVVTVNSANGTTSVSRLGADQEVQGAESAQVSTYPNPVQEQITLEVNLPYEAPLEISVFDMNGRLLVLQETSAVKTYSRDISLSSLKPGIYLLKVNYGKESITKKIIKY